MLISWNELSGCFDEPLDEDCKNRVQCEAKNKKICASKDTDTYEMFESDAKINPGAYELMHVDVSRNERIMLRVPHESH